jgi:hypothetical protein
MTESRFGIATIELDGGDASQIVTALAGLARLMDPDGLDGLSEGLKDFALTDTQRKLLEKPSTKFLADEPKRYADRLRRIADLVESQLPASAPKPMR